MKTHLTAFRRVASNLGPLLAANQLEVHAGCWIDSAALKVQKPAWAEGKTPSTVTNPGIFFSIWIDAKAPKPQQVSYNIHALKLRAMSAYALQSREFAAAFRAKFARASKDWPNVSVDYGPQTLMEGWIDLNEADLEAAAARLVKQFIPLAATIDALLNARRRPPHA
ncbi:MAG: hypothetical protein KA257_01915 [Opitutaceae bacterium]|nr:hypothetical protein [Opitutaceae bacterium]MBP9913361.1 hypothetical protein [Opitutaceae bacterium]